MCPGPCAMEFEEKDARCLNPACQAVWRLQSRGWFCVSWPITGRRR